MDVEGDLTFAGDGEITTSLLDLTTGQTLFTNEESPAPDMQGPRTYSFDVNPTHTYEFDYTGVLNSSDCSTSDFTVDYNLDQPKIVELPALALFHQAPEAASTLCLMAGCLFALAYFRIIISATKPTIQQAPMAK